MDFELIKPDEQDKYDPAPFLNYARGRRTDKQDRDPDIGDAVHLWDAQTAACLAATVVDAVWEADGQHSECLYVLDADAEKARWMHAIPHSEVKRPMSWHWPCGGH